MKILVVIPAREGSKGIPRKNIRLMNGKPLISYSIELVEKLRNYYSIDIALSTNDEEIVSIAKSYEIEIIRRPEELAGDSVTLDPVIYHAVLEMEKKGMMYDIVITIQATSPILKVSTLDSAIKEFEQKQKDTMISVINCPKLTWKEERQKVIPNYKQRLNRQSLPPNYEETGGFMITKRQFVTETSRIGENVGVFIISQEEGIDIDNEWDWITCEALLKKKKIVFRVDGEEELGMGHIYRALTLAYRLIGHEICFVTKQQYQMGVKRLKDSYFPVYEILDNQQFYSFLKTYQPDIVINDILNTTEDYILSLKKLTKRIVNFEDLGKGARYADAVINAVYENKEQLQNMYSGFEYFCIRDEFLLSSPSLFHQEVKKVLISFGGSDPSNLTNRMYQICQKIYQDYKEIEFYFITGFGYPYKDLIKTIEEKNIYVYHDVKRISEFMKEADLAVTSQGRTIYELAYMGVPAIVLAQNKRETSHLFAQIQNGFINLGIGNDQDEKTIIKTLCWLIETPQIRHEMHNLQLSKEFHRGLERVTELILKEK